MQSLIELQTQFVASLNTENSAVLQYVKSSNKLAAKEHLAIYQSSVIGVLQKTLKEIYPVCCKLVGEEFFIRMANDFIPNHPSHSPDLAHYGKNFADFIIHFIPADSLPYLADVARLEWAWHRTFHASETQVIDFQRLAACYTTPGDNIVFSIPAESFLLTTPYPSHRIWEVNQDGFTGDQTVIIEPNTQFYFIVWRKQLTRRIDFLSKVEWQILQWMQAEFTLGKICDLLENKFPEINISEILPPMVANGWLASLKVSY